MWRAGWAMNRSRQAGLQKKYSSPACVCFHRAVLGSTIIAQIGFFTRVDAHRRVHARARTPSPALGGVECCLTHRGRRTDRRARADPATRPPHVRAEKTAREEAASPRRAPRSGGARGATFCDERGVAEV